MNYETIIIDGKQYVKVSDLDAKVEQETAHLSERKIGEIDAMIDELEQETDAKRQQVEQETAERDFKRNLADIQGIDDKETFERICRANNAFDADDMNVLANELRNAKQTEQHDFFK